jgi:hypothetical protein
LSEEDSIYLEMLAVPDSILNKELVSLIEYQNVIPNYVDDNDYEVDITSNNQEQDYRVEDVLIIDSNLDNKINNINYNQFDRKNTVVNESSRHSLSPTYLLQNMINQDLIGGVINHLDLSQSTVVTLESLRIIHLLLCGDKVMQREFLRKGGYSSILNLLLRLKPSSSSYNNNNCNSSSNCGSNDSNVNNNDNNNKDSNNDNSKNDNSNNDNSNNDNSNNDTNNNDTNYPDGPLDASFVMTLIRIFLAIAFDLSIDKCNADMNPIQSIDQIVSNIDVLSVISGLLQQHNPYLKQIGIRVAYVLIRINPLNIVALEKSLVISSLCESLVTCTFQCRYNLSLSTVLSLCSKEYYFIPPPASSQGVLLISTFHLSLLREIITVLQLVGVVISNR